MRTLVSDVAVLALILSLIACGARPAAAQPSSGGSTTRTEWWAAVSGSATGPGGTLRSSYAPPLLFDGDFTSDASQTISTKAGRLAVGFTAGMNVFASRHLGVQLAVDRTSFSMAGPSGAYDVTLRYVSRLPPNDQPQPVDIHQVTAWPDSTGSLTQVAVGLNAVVRMTPSDRIALEIAGGPALFRFTGDLQPIAYTAFHLGGHAVLFEDVYRLGASFEPAYALGFNAAVSVDVAIARHTAITFGYRYFGGPDVDVAVNPTTILNAGEIGIQQPIPDIRSQLSLKPIRVSIASSRLTAGFKIAR
jgi:hypothetical protein